MEPSRKHLPPWGFLGPALNAASPADLPLVEFKSNPPATPCRADAPLSLRVRRLSERAALPAYQTPGSAGLDLAACLAKGERLVLSPGAILVVPTGLALAVPDGFEGQVRPRSGLATKHGVTVANAPGTIDSDYRGEVRVALINLGRQEFVVEHAMRIAQLVIAPVQRVRVEIVEALDPTIRGSGGFGSTGV